MTLLTILLVVVVSCLIDVGFLHMQATRGKLPFKLKLLPQVGGSD